MINTIFATKLNMTQTWDRAGRRLPVTIARLYAPTITQVKTVEKDGYNAVQTAFGAKKYLAKPEAGKLKKAGTTASLAYFREIRLAELPDLQVGATLNPGEIIKVGDLIKATGTSKGRGFAGTVKRHGFSGGPKTHGQSDRQRAPGSIGQGTTPGRVFKGKRMAGRMGNQRFTIENLTVVKVDGDQIWLQGTVPGSRGALLTLTKTGQGKFAGLFEATKDASPKTSDQATPSTAQEVTASNETPEEVKPEVQGKSASKEESTTKTNQS